MKVFLISLALTVCCVTPVAHAQQTSTNYRVEQGSVAGEAGGNSQSASYQTSQTLGEGSVGTNSSASYNVRAGFSTSTSAAAVAAAPEPTPTPSSGGGSGSSSSYSFGILGQFFQKVISVFTPDPVPPSGVATTTPPPTTSSPRVAAQPKPSVMPSAPITPVSPSKVSTSTKNPPSFVRQHPTSSVFSPQNNRALRSRATATTAQSTTTSRVQSLSHTVFQIVERVVEKAHIFVRWVGALWPW